MRFLVVLSLGLGLTAGAPRAQSKPPTVGSVLLMAGGTQLDDTLVLAALADKDPLVRAAAARVIGVFGAAPLLSNVVAALEKETDPHAGAELTRAVLFLNPDAGPAVAETHAQRVGGRAPSLVADWRNRAATAPSGVPNDTMFSRLLPVWQPGLLRELTHAAGCRLSNGPSFGYTRVTYRSDGRALRVAIDPGALPKPCAAVLAAIGRTTLADPERVQHGQQQWIVVPLTKAYAECAEHSGTRQPLKIGEGGLEPPKKVKDVRPEYPRDMLEQRVEGFVVLQATISTGGCVTDARVTMSPALGLELAALRAVSGWMFEPAVVGGAPAPVFMMLTVNFSIRR